jgi:hypothetical protein
MDMDEDIKMDDFNQASIVSSSTVDDSVVDTKTTITHQHDGKVESSTVNTTEYLDEAAAAYLEDSLDSKVDNSMNDFMDNSLDITMDTDLDAQIPPVPGFDTPLAATSDSSPRQAASASPHDGLVEASAGLTDLNNSYSSGTSGTDQARTPGSSPEPSVVVYRAPDPKLPYTSRRTGLVYDPRMRFHTELGATEDDIHPEDPRRIWEIFQELRKEGLVDEDDESEHEGFKPQRLQKIDSRLAQASEVCLVHDEAHWKWVESLESK